MSNHPVLESLASIVCNTPLKTPLRYATRAYLDRLPQKRRQQVFNLLARKLGRGVTVETKVAIPGQSEGVNVSLDLSEDLDRAWYFFGYQGHEAECVNSFTTLASKRDYKTVIEVGANIGYFTLFLASVLKKQGPCHVHAFEPFKPVFESLEKNVRLNPSLTITTHLAAVCDHDGEIALHLPENEHAKMNASIVKGLFKQSGTAMIKAITLDTFVEQSSIAKVDLLKLDCEGAEAAVLRGATKLIQRDKPDIVCEVLEPFEKELTNAFAGSDYLFYHITKDGLVQREKLLGDDSVRDYLITMKRL